MSNFPAIPARGFRVIDETNWHDYWYIGPGDNCWYLWERMSKVKVGEWNQYPTNGFISNLQIPVSCKTDNPHRFKYKAAAIEFAALALSNTLGEIRTSATFVPIPPSKMKDHADHDNRLLRVLKAVRPPISDIRELLLLTKNIDAKTKGLSPDDRASHYAVNESLAGKGVSAIVLFDDVLTTGSHFKAAKNVLSPRFPNVPIVGIFLARAVRPPDEDGF